MLVLGTSGFEPTLIRLVVWEPCQVVGTVPWCEHSRYGSLRIGPLAVVKTDPATGKKDIIPLGKMSVLILSLSYCLLTYLSEHHSKSTTRPKKWEYQLCRFT